MRRLVAESRLVTLTGTAGVGKSRLARRVAGLHGRTFRDGVALVDLDEVADLGYVAEAVAGSLDVPEHAGRDAEAALRDFVAGREMLLVVDNCGHLAESVTDLLEGLLRGAPGLHVLATSREVLGVPGEITYRVEPLPLPADDDPPGAVEVSPAIALFVERAAAAVPGFAVGTSDLPTVVEICRRLDGIPLALELAAAQLRVMSPSELAARLDDRFRILTSRRGTAVARHRTLRAAVEWSYELCDKLERQLWQRLSVFAGDFDLNDAEEVCADDVFTRLDVVEAMRGLVDKSILSVQAQGGSTRFRLLETLRGYGLDRLRECDSLGNGPDEDQLRTRHLAWYADLACQFETEWFGPHQAEWLTRMKAELPDVRAALAFAHEHPEHIRTGLRMAGALCWFWGTTAALREGRSWLVRVLAVGREPTRERARALSALAIVMATIGAPAGGDEVAREALEITRSEDPERLPRALDNVGMMLFPYGDPEALPAMEEAVTRCRERGLGGEELAYATYVLGYGRGMSGDAKAADALFAESIELCRAAGDHWWQGVVRIMAALVSWANGDTAGAAANAVEGLRVCRLVPDLHACAVGLNIAGLLLVGRDDRQAAGLLGTADQYWADAGGSMLQTPVWVDLVEDAKTRCRQTLGDTEFEALYRAGQEQPPEEAAAQVLGEPPDAAAAAAPATRDQFGLTRRERDVAALVAEGLSNRDIAARLVISQRTAETHVQNMLAKTGFSTRSQLAVWFNAHGGT
ncbi:ATP-binding protein [Nocardioides pocheonensis]|uniref:LuxR family transcriptional regulator n=1 Tax=Nocardioides pocheonensis TaxID=661485 RepID=A0A3N0GX17_9ACTN|nr:LuxR C-terminal-related transcriptional regulator [Nocardioides pocheonensis]RNM17013.1 LuxR family transcriptional regulator [Nocardioides pocheonensis]